VRMYVALDVDWPENPKRIRAGLEASAVHAICLCLAKRSKRDGWVARDTLALYGSTDELIQRLEDHRLLDVDGEWVRPHDWLEDNLSSQAIRREKSDKARAANHARWHTGPYASCTICEEKARSSEADPNGVQPESPIYLHRPDTDTDKQQQSKASDADGRRAVLEAAAAIIGERAGSRPTSQNPAKVAAAVKAGVITDRYADAYALIAANPAITPAELAEALEPTETKAHPLDGQQAAQLALAERNRQRLEGVACTICDGAGVYLDADDTAVRCECLKEPA
jgi:hypothetical protein